MEKNSLKKLKEVRGVGESTIDNFREAGIENFEDLRGLSRSDLKDIEGVGASTANSIIRLMENEGIREKKPRTENQEKLQNLLRELFQFDKTDLEFGIYQIMNQKREQIEKFIDSELIDVIDEEFEKYKTENIEKLEKEKEKLKEEIKQNFGDDALNENEEVIEMYKNTPKGKEYMSILRELQDIEISESMEAQVFNDLYNFFKHYYEDGDFLTKRRYSRKNKYAIPYNGEEVYLHWANKEQYYVKTAERFKDYRFRLPDDYFVQFELKEAEVDQNNTIGDKKYFLLYHDDPITYDSKEKTLTVQFEYRPLTDLDLDDYDLSESSRKNTKEDKIRKKVKGKILKFADNKKLLKNALESKERGDDKIILEKNLYQYTKKHTSDYFVHKDLKGFLEKELNFYIKNEILHVDDLRSSSEKDIDKYMGRVRVIKKLGKKIIKFLAQIEDFQKKLWRKKKFVVETEYCLTLDKIPEEYYTKILENEKQIKEWKELYELDEKLNGSIEQIVGEDEINEDFLNNHPSMMVDTKFFDEEFKDKLISNIEHLHEEMDGLLIKSENWHAINLLSNKYSNSLKCIYIDPPFNLSDDKANYLYKSNYKDSTWITMLQDRISLSKNLLDEDGVIFVRCDYHGNMYVRFILENIFGKDKFRNEISVRRFRKNVMSKEIKRLPEGLDTIYLFSKSDKFSFVNPYVEREEKREGYWRHMGDSAGSGSSKNFFGTELEPPEGNHWKFSQENINEKISNGKLALFCTNCGYKHTEGKWKGCPECGEDSPKPKYWVEPSEEKVLDSNWSDIYGYSTNWDFKTENSEKLLKRVIKCSTEEEDLVMDYFLGSGTTASVGQKMNRNWIGIEMGDQFENIIIPRLKKVYYGSTSGISEISEEDNLHGIFKYQKLEQYEDSLNNIQFEQKIGQQELNEIDDYMVNYMLEHETDKSPTLFNIDKLNTPFQYKLNIREGNELEEKVIDIPETFNYLISLEVNKRYSKEKDGRKYLIYRGKVYDEFTIVIWRNTKDIDLDEDKRFITEEILKGYEENVYINQQNVVEDSIPIEKIFKNKMGV